MRIWRGSFSGKKPTITFQITGTQGHPAEVTATVDTGFSGFLCMSADEAAPHAMEFVAASAATLADGARVPVTLSRANVGFAGRTCAGVTTVFQSRCECLVGVDFLRLFQLALVMTESSVLLAQPDDLRAAGIQL